MSENGPREGTKDLPRRDPESGQRSIEPGSPSGRAYELHARQERRRREALLDLSRDGLSPEQIVARYGRDHPFERAVTLAEVRTVLTPADSSGVRRPRSRSE
jgi:hypothetical protein